MLPVDPLPPLSLYVHLPWCVRKCPYCDFNSYESRAGIPGDAYVDALLKDLGAELPLAQGRSLQSIFIGGGTPSLFSGPAVGRLLAGIFDRMAISPDAEITLEANPGAAEAERFTAYREAGVNRLSIGVQSLRDGMLRKLGRIHNSAEAMRACRMAQDAGFDSINLDLMYGLPQDDVAGALWDLSGAISLQPQHVSWYQLTIEPDTAFHRAPPLLPEEDEVLAVEEAGRSLLAAQGYGRYEISAYARGDRQSRHNLNYWEFGDYLGIGAGAHGKVTAPDRRRIERRMKRRNPGTYLRMAGSSASVSVEVINSPAQLRLEFLMNALRLAAGVPAAWFAQRTGIALEELEPAWTRAVALGWMYEDRACIRPTALGQQFLNSLLDLFHGDAAGTASPAMADVRAAIA